MLILIENLLSKPEVAQFRAELDTAEWEDGARTASPLARSRKRNQQLDETDKTGVALGQVILRKLGSHPLFISAALPKRIYPPRFNRYDDGDVYHAHVDAALMRMALVDAPLRSDMSATVFLSEPDEYDGGELEIEGPFGAQSVKLEAGSMVLYLASSLHRVTPVTRGVRVGSFFWIESLVRDDGERTLLFDLDQAIQALTPSVPTDDLGLLKLTGIYHNLLRRWTTT